MRRDLIVNGNMWKVIFVIAGPMMFMNIMTYLYNIIDAVLVADIGAMETSAVAITNQIRGVLQAVNIGFSIPCTILLARLIGKDEIEKAKKLSNLLIVIALCLGFAVCMLGVFGTNAIMQISNVPQTLIAISQTYFAIQIITLGISIFNNVYLSFEKARGATVNIFYVNFIQIIIKILLTVIFVKVFNFGVTMVAMATLISTIVIFFYSVFRLLSKTYIFYFSKNNFSFDIKTTKSVFKLATPIFFGKFVFNLGKVISNSIVVVLGDTSVGALSISNNINAATTTITESMEEVLSVIISQNLGSGNKKRAINSFYIVLFINIIVSILGFVVCTIQMEQILSIFASNDADFYHKIYSILRYERFGVLALGVNSAVMGLLYGFGYTKASYMLNIARLFLFRIPILYYFVNHTNIGTTGVGIAMLASNLAVGIISAVFAVIFLIKIYRNKNITEII